jgi:hypothetical protein
MGGEMKNRSKDMRPSGWIMSRHRKSQTSAAEATAIADSLAGILCHHGWLCRRLQLVQRIMPEAAELAVQEHVQVRERYM